MVDFNNSITRTGHSAPITFTNKTSDVQRTEGTFDFGFKADKTDYTQIQYTTPTPEVRIGKAVQRNFQTVSSLAESAKFDKQVDDTLALYITPETQGRMVQTSYNAAMALDGFDRAFNLLA